MKVIFRYILAVILVIGLFLGAVGCGNGADQNDTDQSKSSESHDDPSDSVSTFEPGRLPFVETNETIKIGIEQSGGIEDFKTNKMTLFMEEKTGLSLDFLMYPSSEMMTKLELAVAGGGAELPDVVVGGFSQQVIMPWAKAEVILNLNEYYENLLFWGYETLETDPDLSLDYIKKYITSYDGNIYGVYGFNGILNNEYSGARLNIYQPWLEKLGLGMPQTTEDLYQTLVAFRDTDLNGNGTKDEIPFTASVDQLGNVRSFLMTPFVYTQPEYWTISDNEIDVAFASDEWREGIKYVNKLYTEKLIDPSMFTQDAPTLTAIISQEPQTVGSFGRISTTNLSAEDPDRYLYDRVEHLTGPDGNTRTMVRPSIPNIKALITKNAKSPELAFMLLDYMNGLDLSIITRYGFEEDTYIENNIEAERDKLEKFWAEQPINYPEIYYGKDFEIPVPRYNYNSSQWGTLQNTWWQQIGPTTMTKEIDFWFRGSTVIETELDQLNYVSEFKHAYHLAETHKLRDDSLSVVGLVYNEEEQAIISDYYAEIKTYVEEMWASFVTGAVDIDDDGAWNNYLSQLENMRLEDCIKVAQQAYDRQRG